MDGLLKTVRESMPQWLSPATSEAEALDKYNTLREAIRKLVNKRTEEYCKQDEAAMDIARHKTAFPHEVLSMLEARPVFDFLETTLGLDPKRSKEKMGRFHDLLTKNVAKFRYPPLGPLCASVLAKKASLCCLLEKILSPYLYNYIARCEEDGIVFARILEEFYSSFERIDLMDDTQFEIKCHVIEKSEIFAPRGIFFAMDGTNGAVSLLSGLSFRQDMEQNAWKILIGKRLMFESTFLFNNEHDAFIFMHSQCNPKYRERKEWADELSTLAAFSQDGYQIYPFPHFKTKNCKIPKKAFYVQVDKSVEIERLTKVRIEYEKTVKLYSQVINELRGLQFKAIDEYERFKKGDLPLVDSNQNDITPR